MPAVIIAHPRNPPAVLHKEIPMLRPLSLSPAVSTVLSPDPATQDARIRAIEAVENHLNGVATEHGEDSAVAWVGYWLATRSLRITALEDHRR